MKKIFTTLAMSLVLGGIGFTAYADNVEWGVPFTATSANEFTYFYLPEYYGMIKVATDSSVDLTYNPWDESTPTGFVISNDMDKDFTGCGPFAPVQKETDGSGNYVYYYNLVQTSPYCTWDLSYAIYLMNQVSNDQLATPIQFTVTKVEEGGGDVEGAPTLLSNASTEAISPNLQVGEYWPNQFVFTWDMQTVKINPSAENYSEGKIDNIPITINGEPFDGEYGTVYASASAVYWLDMGDFGYWDDANDDNPGTAIKISAQLPYEAAPAEGDYVEFTIPAGCALIGASEVENEAYPFKMSVGEGGSGTPTITEGEPFTVSPSTPKYIFNNSMGEEINDFYFVSNSDVNILPQLSFEREDGINIPLQAVLVDGVYYYVKDETRIVEYAYYLTYTGTAEVELTFNTGSYITYPEFKLGEKFIANSTTKEFKMYNATLSGDYYLSTNSATNLIPSGANTAKLVSIESSASPGTNLLQTFEAVLNTQDNVYGYNGRLTVNNATLTFTYSGTDEVEFIFNEGVYTEFGVAEFFDTIQVTPETVSQNDVTAAIELSWGEEVEILNAEAQLSYTINGEPSGAALDAATYLSFKSTEDGEPDQGLSTYTVADGDKGDVLLLLFGGAMGNQLEVGEYVFNLPAGLVRGTQTGKLNPEQKVVITVAAPADVEGIVTPESGHEFEQGTAVVFKVTFESAPVKNEEAEMVFFGWKDGEEEWNLRVETWADANADDVLSIDGNALVINLGADLVPGTYYITLYEDAVKVDGASNAGFYDYMFVVKASDSDAINGIGSENGENVIYNLQGVKVANPVKGGIYIINGKKVVVK